MATVASGGQLVSAKQARVGKLLQGHAVSPNSYELDDDHTQDVDIRGELASQATTRMELQSIVLMILHCLKAKSTDTA